MTYRNNDDKYIYLPRALANRSEESLNTLRRDFGDFASGELHGEYDRGYFKALEDYLSLLSTIKTPVPPTTEAPENAGKEKAPREEKDLE